MWQIIKNEWSSFYRDRVLLGIFISFIILLSITVSLGSIHVAHQNTHHASSSEHIRDKWENIQEMNPHSAAHYGTYVFKPTTLLSGLDDGVSNITGNVLKVEGHVQNEIVHSEASQSQVVSKFGKLKSALLLQYIAPIFLIFLAFHTINGEKLSGRLKLLIAQGASSNKIIFSKALSVWLIGLTLLLVTVFMYLLLNLGAINYDTILRLSFFTISYSLYYFIIALLTTFLSISFSNTSTALTSMLAVWVVWTIFLPNILMSTVESQHKLPSRDIFKSNMKEDRSKGIDGHSPSSDRLVALREKVLKDYGVDSLSQLSINFRGIVMQEDEEYGNKVWDKHFGNLRTVLKNQKKSYQLGGIINPFIALQNTSKGFAASDNLHHQDFLVQVENYRRVFVRTLNNKDAYGGSKTGERGWKADNAFFKSVPDFVFKPLEIMKVFKDYIFDLAILIIWVLVITFLLINKSKRIPIV